VKRTEFTPKATWKRLSPGDKPLTRRKPLTATAGLNNRVKSLAPRSKKKAAAQRDPERDRVREAVFTRDGHACQVAPLATDGCFGGLTYGHRRKEGQGGGYTLANGSTQCAHHNTQLEADADLARRARAAGIVVRRGDPEFDTLGQDSTTEHGCPASPSAIELAP
jgi:hypothetical protein